MNIYLVNILTGLGTIIIGYLLGAIPTGVIFSKVFYKKDIRKYGSGNIGGTNTYRTFGKKAGIFVTLCDMLKTLFAIYSVWMLTTYLGLNEYYMWATGFDARPFFYWLAGFMACVGHCCSIFIEFQGGKAVACFMAMCIGTCWLCAIIAIIFFVIVKFRKMVSLSSLISGLLEVIIAWGIILTNYVTNRNLGFLMWTFNMEDGLQPDLFFAVFVTLSYIILVYRHKSNIKRIAEGTENKINI